MTADLRDRKLTHSLHSGILSAFQARDSEEVVSVYARQFCPRVSSDLLFPCLGRDAVTGAVRVRASRQADPAAVGLVAATLGREAGRSDPANPRVQVWAAWGGQLCSS
mgnify:CR=1 FL=1